MRTGTASFKSGYNSKPSKPEKCTLLKAKDDDDDDDYYDD
jgi:hypothetical protein